MKRLVTSVGLSAAVLVGLGAGHVHAAPAPSRHIQLVRATNTFGYWFTYFARNSTTAPSRLLPARYVNDQVNRYTIPGYAHRPGTQPGGQLIGDLGLGNIPSGYRFHIDSFSSTRAVETIHWLFGKNPHTPVDRVTWTYTSSGWKISAAKFLRIS